MLADLRLAVRRLVAAPAFSAVAVLTLALGIGANTAIASIIAAVLFRPLPLDDSDRVVAVRAVQPNGGQTSTISTRDVEDWTRDSRTIEAFAAWRDWSFARPLPTGRERYYGIIATPGIFRVLRVRPLMGRVFTDEENTPGRGGVILLTERTWRGRFAADPGILGRTLILSRAPHGDRPFTVIGIMPDIDIPSLADVTFYAPSIVDEDALADRDVRNRRVWARLRGGVALSEARAELTGLAAGLARAFPASHGGWGVEVRPLVHAEVGTMRGTLLFFAAAIGFVLLIACANIAGLLIARAMGRAREFAVRSALGGRPFHMVKLVIAEALVLGGAAGIASVLLRMWLLDAIAGLGPAIPRMAPISAAAAAAITIALSLCAAMLFGMLPAWQASRLGVAEAIRRGGSRSASGGGVAARSWLVGLQIALALMLLSAAAVSLRTLARVLASPAGFDPRGVMVAQLFPSAAKYATREALAQLVPRIIEDVRTLPGVKDVSVASAGPLFGGQEPTEVTSEGAPPRADGSNPRARYFDSGPNYLRAIGATLVDGRDFTERDAAGAPPVAIVNETLARRLWPGERAVGRRLTSTRTGEQREVVGVVADFPKGTNDDPVEPELYWPYLQRPRWAFYLVVRAAERTDTVYASLRARLAEIDKDLVPSRADTMDALLARATRGERFGAFVLGIFAATALLLAALGTYGLVSYSAAQRTREIGIRMSFGASPADIRRLVLRAGLLPVLAGTAAGLAGTLAATRGLASVVPLAEKPDMAALLVAASVLILTSIIACTIPVRRATRIDPMQAVRID